MYSFTVFVAPQDLEVAGENPEEIDVQAIIEIFESIFQEDYYHDILRQAIMEWHWEQVLK